MRYITRALPRLDLLSRHQPGDGIDDELRLVGLAVGFVDGELRAAFFVREELLGVRCTLRSMTATAASRMVWVDR